MHQELMSIYKNMLSLVKTQYINDFTETIETKGKVLLFNNKIFILQNTGKIHNRQEKFMLFVCFQYMMLK